MAVGTMMLAAAVFEAVSDITTAIAVNTIVNPTDPASGKRAAIPWPSAADNPVVSDNRPIARPPPNNSTMPQSMRDASAHDNVKRRSRQLTGITSSSNAPTIAATDSGNNAPTCRVAACVSPNIRLNTPGTIHNAIVTANAYITLRSPRVVAPSFRSSSDTVRTVSG